MLVTVRFHNCRILPLHVELLNRKGVTLYTWAPLFLDAFWVRYDQGTFSLYSDSGEEIVPYGTSDNYSPDDCWHTIKISTHEPETGRGHVCYAALMRDKADMRSWQISRMLLMDAHAPDINITYPKRFVAKTVHIIARNITPRDAVSNFALGLARLLEQIGFVVRLYAHDISHEYAGIVSHVGSILFEETHNDIILYHYSIPDNFFEAIARLNVSRKILYYHNVTPGYWFRQYSQDFADLLDSVAEQFTIFSEFDVALANSRYSLSQISSYLHPDCTTYIHPPCFALKRLEEKSVYNLFPVASGATLLWVGRITPHKRPELALQIYNELSLLSLDASLVFVGGGRHDFPAFADHLDKCLADLPEEARSKVLFLENLSDGQLAWLYKNASLLLCTSAHEGYCMPLMEAAVFNLPVAVMPQPAVLETLNGRGLVLDEAPRVAAIQIRDFLLHGDEQARKAATPVFKKPQVEDLIRIIFGES